MFIFLITDLNSIFVGWHLCSCISDGLGWWQHGVEVSRGVN